MSVVIHASGADTKRTLSAMDAQRIGAAVKGATSSSRFYNADGTAAGRSQASGNATRFYQASGSCSGRTQRSGATVYFDDASGRLEACARKSGNTTIFYDSGGRLGGRATTSGRAVEDYWQRGKRLGVFAFLPKPYKAEKLVRVVEQVLRSIGRRARA